MSKSDNYNGPYGPNQIAIKSHLIVTNNIYQEVRKDFRRPIKNRLRPIKT